MFVDVFRNRPADTSRFVSRSAAIYDLNVLAQRLIGVDEARRLFEAGGRADDLAPDHPIADDALITELERKLAGSVGAASARAMVSQVVTGETISLAGLVQDRGRDAARARLQPPARGAIAGSWRPRPANCGTANERLRQLDSQKDDFLSQVSHEVRTPMTSIRSFSEILLESPHLERAQSAAFPSHHPRRKHPHDPAAGRHPGPERARRRQTVRWALAPTDPDVALDNAVGICRGPGRCARDPAGAARRAPRRAV